MVLLEKGLYQFKKIVSSGYEIHERVPLIRETQLPSGKIKRVFGNYEDVTIKLTFDGFDAFEIAEFLDNLTYGNYKYWSVKHMQYIEGTFVVDQPIITMKNAQGGMMFDKVTVTLRRTYE